MPPFGDPNSSPITLSDKGSQKVLSDLHFALAEQWPQPYYNHPLLAFMPTEVEQHLPLESLPWQSALGD